MYLNGTRDSWQLGLLTTLLVLWQATIGLCTNVNHYRETYKDKDVQDAGQNQHIASPKPEAVIDHSQLTGPQPGMATCIERKRKDTNNS
jgi:predicted glycosyl hydrolase (DUF1957 family)